MKLLHVLKAFLFQKKYDKFDVSIPVPSLKTYFVYIWTSKFPNLFLTALMNTF